MASGPVGSLRFRSLLWLILTTPLLIHCGGGSNSSPSPPASSAPTETVATQRVLRGVIQEHEGTALSVLDEPIDAGSAQIFVNGTPDADQPLPPGSVAEIVVDNQGRALVIDLFTAVEGTVDAVDPAGPMLIVLGQRVRITSDTLLGDITLESLAVGNIVSVSGFPLDNGDIIATRISFVSDAFQDPGNQRLRLAGYVTSTDPDALRLTIGNLTVDIGNVTLDTLPQAGDFIAVSALNLPTPDAVLTADTVSRWGNGLPPEPERIDPPPPPAEASPTPPAPVPGPNPTAPQPAPAPSPPSSTSTNTAPPPSGGSSSSVQEQTVSQLAVSGAISRVFDDGSFELAGLRIKPTPQTIWVNGRASDIARGKNIFASGIPKSPDTLIAEEIHFGRKSGITNVSNVEQRNP